MKVVFEIIFIGAMAGMVVYFFYNLVKSVKEARKKKDKPSDEKEN